MIFLWNRMRKVDVISLVFQISFEMIIFRDDLFVFYGLIQYDCIFSWTFERFDECTLKNGTFSPSRYLFARDQTFNPQSKRLNSTACWNKAIPAAFIDWFLLAIRQATCYDLSECNIFLYAVSWILDKRWAWQKKTSSYDYRVSTIICKEKLSTEKKVQRDIMRGSLWFEVEGR